MTDRLHYLWILHRLQNMTNYLVAPIHDCRAISNDLYRPISAAADTKKEPYLRSNQNGGTTFVHMSRNVPRGL